MNKAVFIFISVLTMLSCGQPIARRPISISSGSKITQSVLLNKKIKDRDEKWIKEIISKDTAHHYLNNGNGFWYYYTKKDSIPKNTPTTGDLVNFEYNIKKLDGSIIYSKNKFKNQTYRIDKEELFLGMREGLKLLQEGESATFLFPSHVAFGFYGDLEKIGHNIPIISEVTVNSIFKK